MAPPAYVAVYERDPSSPAWNVWVDGAPGVHTFGTRLVHARANVREALALWLDVEEASLEEEIRLPDGVDQRIGELEVAREELARSRSRVSGATIEAARALVDAGISTRDAAELLRMSHQRISQVLSRDGGI